jgi:hypothetical protein
MIILKTHITDGGSNGKIKDLNYTNKTKEFERRYLINSKMNTKDVDVLKVTNAVSSSLNSNTCRGPRCRMELLQYFKYM